MNHALKYALLMVLVIAIGAFLAAKVVTAGSATAMYSEGSLLLTLTPTTAATVTNGQAIAISRSYVKLTCAAAQVTNTVANATYAGQFLVLENAGTNEITIADDSTSMAIGADAVLGGTDTLTLIAAATNQWRKISTSDN